ncbi:hypothetical protein [Bordetella genomosp. 1]|uniref:Uncharacterized protein n=1 Tax=Bordetella genomosp. 1 TaxID=1395607 RepID=A0ABX4EUZ3_9BORD|nr:hypothetical protein [Bordetella genomosp. 1]OZI57161.1 hypothetical protein CAL27_23225 [Bordetella genomosp. 1]
MKEHVGTSLVSTLEVLQPNVMSFFWRLVTLDEAAGLLHCVTETAERFSTYDEAWAAGMRALDDLQFA